MTFFRSTSWWVVLCFGHALVLALLTLVWMNLSWEFSDEVIVARINQMFKYEVFAATDPHVEEFKRNLVCVNGSYDKALIPFSDEVSEGLLPITDRKKLTRFIQIINQAPEPPQLVVVDIRFDYASEDDSLLRMELRKIQRLVISTERNESGQIVRPWPELNFANAQYATTSGTFLKYNLMDDTIPYLPAAMYKLTQPADFYERMGLIRGSGGWWLNSFMVDLPIRQSHIDSGEVLLWNLGDVLTYELPDVYQLIRGKVIIIGDYKTYDQHETLLGEQPGPLIVANGYLGMLQGIPRIRGLDLLLITLLYFGSSLYVVLWKGRNEKMFIFPRYRWKVGKFVLKYFTYLLLFSIYSVFLYFLTSRHFQLLLFGLYFNVFEFAVDRYRQKRQQKLLEMELAQQETHSVTNALCGATIIRIPIFAMERNPLKILLIQP